ncbi:MAG TPA: hypothetical protein VGW78_01595, partial [Candidatus Babeliales bacterium]|nr:hypothetical protein [Candidatus Babeliales bacterium]
GLSYPEAHKIASGEVEQGLSNKRAIEKPNVPTKFVTPIDNQPKPTTTACPGGASQQEKPTGCGDTNPKVDPIAKGCGEAPQQDSVDCKFPGEPVKPILHFKQSVDDATNTIMNNLPNVKKFGSNNNELEQYISDITFEDAVEIVKTNTSPNSVKTIATPKGLVIVFVYDNGTVAVRQYSSGIKGKGIDGLPTIEIIKKGEELEKKIRCGKGLQTAVEIEL